MPAVPVAAVPLSTWVLVLNETPLGRAPLSLYVGAGKPVVVTVKVPAVPTTNVVWSALVIAGAAGARKLTVTVPFVLFGNVN